MTSRNPSPPLDFSEELQNADNIGDSAYSKRWLFSLMMELLNYAKSVSDTHDEETGIRELNPELETKLCCLWDLTVNRDILPHLGEFNIIGILTDVLLCQQYPRLQEIIIGILANLAYDTNSCQKMSENEECILRVLNLFYSRDTPTLTEVCRLVHTILASYENNAPWIDAIRFQEDFFDNMLFILKCSTHGSLLITAVRLIDAITREDDSLAEVWCVSELLEAILVAQHQMKWLHGDEVETIHRLLYTFSSNANGVASLIKLFDEVLPTFGVYLRKVCEDEPHLIPFSAYYNSLRAIIPVVDSVIASVSVNKSVAAFAADRTVLPCLSHIAMGCQKQVDNFPLARDILADLNILFKDLVSAIQQRFQQLSPTREHVTLSSELADDLRWLVDLDADNKFQSTEEEDDFCLGTAPVKVAGLRESFVQCCLNDSDEETRGKLISICHYLKLPKLLETITDD